MLLQQESYKDVSAVACLIKKVDDIHVPITIFF
jgi:hypothetical protein